MDVRAARYFWVFLWCYRNLIAWIALFGMNYSFHSDRPDSVGECILVERWSSHGRYFLISIEDFELFTQSGPVFACNNKFNRSSCVTCAKLMLCRAFLFPLLSLYLFLRLRLTTFLSWRWGSIFIFIKISERSFVPATHLHQDSGHAVGK